MLKPPRCPAAPLPRLFVVFEGIRFLTFPRAGVLEHVDQAHGGLERLDAGLEQGEVGIGPEAELIEPLRLGFTDVSRRGTAGGIGILVKADQRLPMLVTGALDRGANLIPAQCHVRARGAAPTP